jgi:pyrroline-5-carboxylate reductase
VFLGAGRITNALVTGLRLGGFDMPIVVHDHHSRNLKPFKKPGVKVEPVLDRAVQQAEVLVIAVRPQSVFELLGNIGETGNAITAISLAAGIPLSRLRGRLGPRVRWARAMPSPVCRIARGLTAIAYEKGFPRAARRQVTSLFGTVGQVIEVAESKFDAFTVTYSSSHGYHALATLAEAAERCGLDRKTALLAAAHALGDGVNAWRRSGVSLEKLLEEAATPGGIASTVMTRMNESGYRKIVERGLRDGMSKAKTNARR